MTERRLYQSVAGKIVALIDSGEFPAGARLPGERELAERFGVSRVTIREAEIALQAIGRIEIKTGSGVYVAAEKPGQLDQLPAVSAFELTEARAAVEGEVAALAAQNITDEVIARLKANIAGMTSSDGEVATAADREFHLTIAAASGNAALTHMVQILWRMRSELPEVRKTYESVCDYDGETRGSEHQAICDALAAHNPDAARKAMRSHFRRLIESMLDATEREALAEVQKRASASRDRFLASAPLG